MVNTRRLACIFLVPTLGCAASAGSASYSTLRADYARTETRHSDPLARDLASQPVLERAEYVRAVLRQNPTVESARQGWRAAVSRIKQAGPFDDPEVELGLAPLTVGSKAPFGYELAVSQRLPWFGKRSLESAAATAEAGAAKSDYEITKRDLALSALVLYDQYFVAVRALEINHRHVELMGVLRKAALSALEVGRGSAQDPLQAEAELAHMEHDTALLTSERDVTIAQMNELLHRSPELPLPPPSKELPLPLPALADTKRLEADAVSGRTEITAARQRAAAAQAQAARAERDAYPDLTLSTAYNSMWDMPEHRWMVGVGFNLPIQSARRTGARDESLALRSQLESEALRLTDAAKTQAFVAHRRLEESKHVLALFEGRLLPVARDQIDAARAGFTTSQTPFMAVVLAEKNLRSVELDYEKARAECAHRHAELERALGRIPGIGARGGDR